VTTASGALGGLLDEIEETARPISRGRQPETGATSRIAEQQFHAPRHDR
jgi:hypothetical protein